MLNSLIKDLEVLKDRKRAKVSAWFFKTGKGQYGEGDVFLGITVPKMREVAKKYTGLDLPEVQKLLLSQIHEHRFLALVILVDKFKKALRKTQGKLSETEQKKIFDFYIKNAKNINNWDLVDSSAEYIVGEYLFGRERGLIYKLAKSKNLWEKRIAIISTFAFIKRGKFEDTFKVAEVLLSDSHDLIHKAVGWMLREVGKRDQKAEEAFLQKYYKQMPRTMLRYAIEKFDPIKRKIYMAK